MMDLIEARKLLELSLAEYAVIRSIFWSEMHDAIRLFLYSEKNEKELSDKLKASIDVAYYATANLAWVDGDKELPLNAIALAYTVSAIAIEHGHANGLVERLGLLKQEEAFDPDLEMHEASERADGYSRTLDILYAVIRLMAADKKMLTFVGDDGQESCKDCQKYKGQRHRASWWVSHNAIPPNRDFKCGGWLCQHVLVDDKGQLYTI